MSETCKDCGALVVQQEEKAIGEPRERAYQIVWADFGGNWVCPVTGDEHVPGEPNRPVQVTITYKDNETMMRLSLAEYGNFIADPIINALDDGDASWDAREQNPERHTSLMTWAHRLFGVTA